MLEEKERWLKMNDDGKGMKDDYEVIYGRSCWRIIIEGGKEVTSLRQEKGRKNTKRESRSITTHELIASVNTS